MTQLSKFALALAVVPRVAHANEPPASEKKGVATKDETSVARPGDYWSNQEVRPFVGAQAGVGIVSRAALSVGYGKPNDMWVGVEGGALVAPGFYAFTGQVCFDFLLLNLEFGIRQTDSFSRAFPTLRSRYDSDSLYDATLPTQSLTSFDALLYGYIPLGPTLGYWDVGYERELNAPTSRAMYLEYLAVVVHAPEAWSGRYAWHLNLLKDRMRVGPMFDFVASPGRKETFRVGGSLIYTFSEHVSAILALTAPVSSPDDLGLNGWWGLGRITWAWASGEPRPGLW